MHNVIRKMVSHPYLLFTTYVWLNLEFFIFGKFSFIGHVDFVELFISPQASMAGLFPLSQHWYPMQLSGTDLQSVSSFNGADTVLFQFFPPFVAQFLIIQLLHAVAYFSVYRVSRDVFGASKTASLIAATVYLMSMPPSLVYDFPVRTLPLVIWIFWVARQRMNTFPRLFIVTLLGLLYAHFSTLQIMLPFTAIFLGIWFLLFLKQEWKYFIDYIVFILATVFARALDIYTLILHAPNSNRVDARDYELLELVFDSFSFFRVWEIVRSPTTIVIGWVVFLLVIAAFVWGRHGRSTLGQLFAGMIIVVGIAFGLHVLFVRWEFMDGVFSGFNMNRLHWHNQFLFALAAALAYDIVLNTLRSEGRDGKSNSSLLQISKILPVGLTAMFILASFYMKANNAIVWAREGNFVLHFESEELKRLKKLVDQPSQVPFRAQSYNIHPSVVSAYGIEVAGGYIPLYQGRYRDYWTAVIEPYFRANPALRQIASEDTMNRLYLQNSPAAAAGTEKTSDLFNLHLLSLANVKYFVAKDFLLHPDLMPLSRNRSLAFWNNLSKLEKLKRNLLRNFGGDDGLMLFENLRVLPRFFFAEKVVAVERLNDVLPRMVADEAGILARNIYLFTGDATPPSTVQVGKVKVTTYAQDRIVLKTVNDGAGLLYIGNNFNPYWKALIDGVPSPLFPANYTFSGVMVPAGKHIVELRYVLPSRSIKQVVRNIMRDEPAD